MPLPSSSKSVCFGWENKWCTYFMDVFKLQCSWKQVIYIYIYITYRNFHTFTQADYPQFLQWWEKNFNRLPTLVDNPHPKTKENLKLKQSFDIISFSVQLIIFHTFCLRFFIENDTTCKICSRKKSDISRSTESEKSLYWNG